MKESKNKGYDLKTIEEYKSKIQASGTTYILDETDEHTDEYVHLFFVGRHEGVEVIFDCVLYTLRFQHESELFEIAEQKALEHFPVYQKIKAEAEAGGALSLPDELEEKIGLYIAETLVELEEEGEVKVKEHVDLDTTHEFGIGVDAGLNVERITAELISSFVSDFNADTLHLDESLYSFQINRDDFEL